MVGYTHQTQSFGICKLLQINNKLVLMLLHKMVRLKAKIENISDIMDNTHGVLNVKFCL